MTYRGPMADQLLERPGARLAYSLDDTDLAAPGAAPGTRRVVVTAHGLTGSRAREDAGGAMDWRPLARVGRWLRYDARGHGASTGRPVPEDYTWPALGDDLLALVDAVSPDEPVDAVGASMGTASILWAALRRPDRFRRLVLSMPPTAWETRAAQSSGYEAAAATVERQGVDVWLRAAAAQPPVPIVAAGGWARPPEPAIAADLLPSVLRGAARSDLPSPDALAALRHPVLLLPWTTDPGHPVSTAERLAAVLPSATLEVADTPEAVAGWGERAARFLAG